MKRVILLFALGAVALGTACSSETLEPTDDDGADETEDAFSSSCTGAKGDWALARYYDAIAWSTDRLAALKAKRSLCTTEHHSLLDIANEASKAVTMKNCGDFRKVIKHDKQVKPYPRRPEDLREVLAQSLTLKSLTGELHVTKDSPDADWSGVGDFKGLTFWAQADAFGSKVHIDFKEHGKASYNYLAPPFYKTWISEDATFKLKSIDGFSTGKRRVTVVHAGKTETFTLGVIAGAKNAQEGTTGAPIFVLEPANDGATKAPRLLSLVDECKAN